MKPSSSLTRAVFRAIINNEPYRVAECARHHLLSPRPSRSLTPYTPKRTRMFGAIFNTLDRGFEGARNTPNNLELALGKLVDLVKARRMQSRGPTDEEALSALRFLFLSRLESRRRLTRNEVYLATEVFAHFQEKGLAADITDKSHLTINDLNTILETLALPSERERFRSDTRALAMMVFALLPSATKAQSSVEATPESIASFPVYATILARTGSAPEAWKLLQKSAGTKDEIFVWIEVLKGLAMEGRRQELINTMREMHKRGKILQSNEYEELISFLAKYDFFHEASTVYESQIANRVEQTTEELKALLELCVRVGELEYGKPIAEALIERINEDGVLGSLFIWTAVSHERTDQAKQATNELLKMASPEAVSMSPFNRLVEFGSSNDRPDIIAAALEIAQSFGVQVDGKFHALQLRYALQRGDLPSAQNFFEELIRQDVPADNSDIEVLNRYAAALAFSPEPDYSLLMRVVDILLERRADFDAEALAGVCRVFLQTDELEDLTGLLRHRVDFYPGIDRARISAVFQQFILDRSVKVERAFNAYELFRIAFPETSVENRLPIMQSFFDRNRPDLACLVFGHMRQREDTEARPTSDAYAKCFQGIAQCRDVDGLQMVYNMLKLDLEVEMTTKVRNGLMLAYIACQMPYTAMIDHFWKIMDSREGPTYSTFEIALRACETWIPQGGYEARKIMAIVQAWNLEVTKELYDCYVGAIAGQSEFENTVELIEEMESETGERPDVFTLGAFYNAIPWQYRKDEVEKWAKKAYPDLWEDLESFGDEIDEEWEIRYFKIDRSIDIEDAPLFADGKYDPQISRDAIQPLEPPSERPQSSESTL